MRKSLFLFCFTALILMCVQAHVSATYAWENLGYGSDSGINNLGQVATGGRIYNGNGTYTPLSVPTGWYATATEINDNGTVFGLIRQTNTSTIHKAIWKAGTLYDLGGFYGALFDVNNSDQVVGYNDSYAFIWENGSLTNLTATYPGVTKAIAINNSGQIAVEAASGGAIIENGTLRYLTRLPGSGRCDVQAMNDRGDAIGHMWYQEYHSGTWETVKRPCVWIDGVPSLLTWEERRIRDIHAINSRGQVVGQCVYGAFMWENGTFTYIGDLGAPAGSHLIVARDINDLGQITGSGDQYVYRLTPVPEPSGMLALFSTVAGLAGMALRRKN